VGTATPGCHWRIHHRPLDRRVANRRTDWFPANQKIRELDLNTPYDTAFRWMIADMDRFDDGEVTRYGAGESWRPFPRDRSPRRQRSPPRDRDRERDRPRERERPRSPPPIASDSYVPNRSPRRRSRSGERFRRERSRGADTWRRRERTRSPPPRRPSPRRPSPRRPSPRRPSPRRPSPRRGASRRGTSRRGSPRRGSIGRRSPPYGRSPAWRDDRRARSPPPRGGDGPFVRRDDR
jgi:hypothetical protein